MLRRTMWALLLAATACGADEDSSAGGGGGGGGINEEPPACQQIPTCDHRGTDAITRICVEDSCLPVGLRDDEGNALRSSMYVFSEYPREVSGYRVRSAGVTFLHPLRPNGERLTCDDLLALEPAKRKFAGYTNIVGWNAVGADGLGAGDTIPTAVSRIPVNDPDVAYLVLSELWSGPLDSRSHENTGAVIAEGCLDGVQVVEGHYLDENHEIKEEHHLLLGVHWVEAEE